jgi:hypothetical protein
MTCCATKIIEMAIREMIAHETKDFISIKILSVNNAPRILTV